MLIPQTVSMGNFPKMETGIKTETTSILPDEMPFWNFETEKIFDTLFSHMSGNRYDCIWCGFEGVELFFQKFHNIQAVVSWLIPGTIQIPFLGSVMIIMTTSGSIGMGLSHVLVHMSLDKEIKAPLSCSWTSRKSGIENSRKFVPDTGFRFACTTGLGRFKVGFWSQVGYQVQQI